MARVTLFRPLSSKAPEYENRLTWAFLVALNYDPILQNFFRGLVETKLPHSVLGPVTPWEFARVSSQTKSIDASTIRLVSILLTDEDIKYRKIKWSNREAVYDGVIEYSDGLTFIIENKPLHENTWDEQLSPSKNSYSGDIKDVELHPSAICLEWSEILEGVLNYANSGIATYGSRRILYDFLSLVEELHPHLTPYHTFKICDGIPSALKRRTVRLLDTLARRLNLESREDWYLFRPNKIAERVGIWVEEKPNPQLKVVLWPADTVSQAHQFFKSVDREAFLGLENWSVEPNPHFSYVSRHLIWATATMGIEDYFDYFFRRRDCFGKWVSRS